MEGESSGVQQAQGQVGRDKNQQQDGQEPGVDAQTGQKQGQQAPPEGPGERGRWHRLRRTAQGQGRRDRGTHLVVVCQTLMSAPRKRGVATAQNLQLPR